jgi:hypothetical protein
LITVWKNSSTGMTAKRMIREDFVRIVLAGLLRVSTLSDKADFGVVKEAVEDGGGNGAVAVEIGECKIPGANGHTTFASVLLRKDGYQRRKGLLEVAVENFGSSL